jgi:hypothetical protein
MLVIEVVLAFFDRPRHPVNVRVTSSRALVGHVCSRRGRCVQGIGSNLLRRSAEVGIGIAFFIRSWGTSRVAALITTGFSAFFQPLSVGDDLGMQVYQSDIRASTYTCPLGV